MECEPTAREAVVIVAFPAASSGPVPIEAPLSSRFIVPVGTAPEELVTVTMYVRDWPPMGAFRSGGMSVVVVGSKLTT